MRCACLSSECARLCICMCVIVYMHTYAAVYMSMFVPARYQPRHTHSKKNPRVFTEANQLMILFCSNGAECDGYVHSEGGSAVIEFPYV